MRVGPTVMIDPTPKRAAPPRLESPMPTDATLGRLERKIDRLNRWMSLQTLLLFGICAAYLVQLVRFVVVLFILLLAIAVVYRDRLPTWYRQVARIGDTAARIWRYIRGWWRRNDHLSKS